MQEEIKKEKRNYCIFVCVFVVVQTEPPAFSGSDAGWSERRGSGEHAVGNSDVPVREKGSAPIFGTNAAVRPTRGGDHKEGPQKNGNVYFLVYKNRCYLRDFENPQNVSRFYWVKEQKFQTWQKTDTEITLKWFIRKKVALTLSLTFFLCPWPVLLFLYKLIQKCVIFFAWEYRWKLEEVVKTESPAERSSCLLLFPFTRIASSFTSQMFTQTQVSDIIHKHDPVTPLKLTFLALQLCSFTNCLTSLYCFISTYCFFLMH